MKLNRITFHSRIVLCLGAALLCMLRIATAAEPVKIIVAVPGPGSAAYFPIEMIPRIGADKAEGAEVVLKFVPGGGVALEQMLTNNVDFAVVGLPAAMSARLKDPRVVSIAAVNDLPLYVLLVRQGLKGKVTKIADLNGKTIGVHSNSVASKTNSHQLLELVLARNGVTPDMVRTVAVGQRWESESSMLQSGDADAIMGDEPYATRMMQDKIAYPLLHLGDPAQAKAIPGGGFLRGAVIARTDMLDKNPQKVELFTRVVRRTLAWLASHSPEETINAGGMSGKPEGDFFLQTLKKFPRQYSKDGKFSTQQLKETETFFHESQRANAAATTLKVESMIVDRWAGRKD